MFSKIERQSMKNYVGKSYMRLVCISRYTSTLNHLKSLKQNCIMRNIKTIVMLMVAFKFFEVAVSQIQTEEFFFLTIKASVVTATNLNAIMDSVLHHLYDVMETWRAPTTQMNEIVRAFPANSSVATAIVFVLTTYVTGFNIALTVPTRQTAVGNIKFM